MRGDHRIPVMEFAAAQVDRDPATGYRSPSSGDDQLYFNPPEKAVILSEALRRSIANRGLYGAESKDPGDACRQMLLEVFRPQTTPEDIKVTNSERSASQIYRVTRH
jgi:hypothetical protein